MRQLRYYLALEQAECSFIDISRSNFTSLCGTVLKKPNNAKSKCKKLEIRDASVLKELYIYFFVTGGLV